MRQSRLVINARNKLRQFILRELQNGDELSSRDLAKRICLKENKNTHDQRMILDVTKRVSKAVAEARAVKGPKDRTGRWVWLAP